MEKEDTEQTDAFISSELWMLMIKIRLIFLNQLKQTKDDSEARTHFFFLRYNVGYTAMTFLVKESAL